MQTDAYVRITIDRCVYTKLLPLLGTVAVILQEIHIIGYTHIHNIYSFIHSFIRCQSGKV